MTQRKKRTDSEARKQAEDLVRRILVTDFGQKMDKKSLTEVAERVRRSLPQVEEREKVPA